MKNMQALTKETLKRKVPGEDYKVNQVGGEVAIYILRTQ